ncbi:hypothetical protein AAG570_001891 [Ranatra chinensis]|uniref:Uncharacterized protein n=1 Tax=Ranatra chinensis TaxID=642074 RepID=A0ABD0Y9V1_9HEMI
MTEFREPWLMNINFHVLITNLHCAMNVAIAPPRVAACKQAGSSTSAEVVRFSYHRCEIRSVIKFLALRRVSAAEIHYQFVDTYVDPDRFRLIAIFSGAVWVVTHVATVVTSSPPLRVAISRNLFGPSNSEQETTDHEGTSGGVHLQTELSYRGAATVHFHFCPTQLAEIEHCLQAPPEPQTNTIRS